MPLLSFRRFFASWMAFLVLVPVILALEAIVMGVSPLRWRADSTRSDADPKSPSEKSAQREIRAIAVSDDGDYLEVAEGDADSIRRDALTGRKLTEDRLSKSRLRCLQLRSRDYTWVGLHPQNELEVVHQSRTVWRAPLPGLPDAGTEKPRMTSSLCPTQNRVAVISDSGYFWLLDFDDTQANCRGPYDLGTPLGFVAMSPAGDHVLLVTANYQMLLWDVALGRVVTQLKTEATPHRLASWSGNGRRLITFGNSRDVAVWDVPAGTILHQFQVNLQMVISAELSEDGNLAAVGDGDVIRLWDLATGDEHPPLVGHDGVVSILRFADQGRTLFSGDAQGGLRRWSLTDHREVWAAP